MTLSEGILTARGGMTSHAAVVARGMGKCCVSGAGDLVIDYKNRTITVGTKTYKEGDWISLNGSTGVIYEGKVATKDAEVSGDFAKLMELADEFAHLKVRANADTPRDAKTAFRFGAQGIGLCRTEHMFFEGDRIKAVREMILADDEEGRRKALAKLLPMQRGDFEGLFETMNGHPVTVRLLDPPLRIRTALRKGDARHGSGNEGLLRGHQEQGGRTGRVEPDAGSPWLPPGQHLSRNHRDADPRHH
ncbi:MAG: putative PEP-binding protein [Alistipes indistinctus]